MNILDLIRKTYIYRVYHKKQVEKLARNIELRKLYFRKEGELLLTKFTEALNSNGIMFWLEFGTLLGYYREHDFISHDCDLDFGVNLCDANRVRQVLENNGFKCIIRYKSTDGGMEECYKYEHTTLDVFYFRTEDEKLYCTTYTTFMKNIIDRFSNSKPCTVKKIYIPNNGFSKVSYKDCEVYVPNKIEDHLIMHYGKSFMIPNPEFDYKKEATNIVYYNYSDVSGQSMRMGSKFDD